MDLRFVIHLHTGHGAEHFDMMFQTSDSLATWQFSTDPSAYPPTAGPARTLACRRIQDHRTAYLEYEGPVSAGRGAVRRCEQGQYRLLESDENRWLVELNGGKLAGRFELLRKDGDNWEFRRLA